MQKSIGVIMDPISQINIKKDSTFAMLLEIQQRRECQIFYMEQTDLFLKNEIPYAKMRSLKVQWDTKNWFELGQPLIRRLNKLTVILMRKDPPIDMQYIYTTQLLEKAEKQGVQVINRPQSLRDFNEKMFTLQFPQCCPPTLVTPRISRAKKFLEHYEDVIAKPLEGMGGFSVFRIQKKDPNINVILETLSANNRRYMVLQKYIPEISAGDKRILMIYGEPVDYALARKAPEGETRANLAVGGKGVGIKLSKRDYWICQQVGPVLHEKGLFFVGLDVIGDYLTEINITSPTGICELDRKFKLNIAGMFVDKFIK
jgi:glutathione synthase